MNIVIGSKEISYWILSKFFENLKSCRIIMQNHNYFKKKTNILKRTNLFIFPKQIE